MVRSKRLFASAFVVASSSATSLVAGVAHAQTVTGTATVTPGNNGFTYRYDAQGNDVTQCCSRPENLNPTGISFNDCITNMSLGFPVTYGGFLNTALEVGVGTVDCSQDTARGIGLLATCWKVFEQEQIQRELLDDRVHLYAEHRRVAKHDDLLAESGELGPERLLSAAIVRIGSVDGVFRTGRFGHGHLNGTAASFPVNRHRPHGPSRSDGALE